MSTENAKNQGNNSADQMYLLIGAMQAIKTGNKVMEELFIVKAEESGITMGNKKINERGEAVVENDDFTVK